MLLFILLVGASYLARALLQLKQKPPQDQQTDHATVTGQQTKPSGGLSEEHGFKLTPADKFALNLRHTFDDNGYDIDVFVIDRALTLKSELFKNASSRESLINQLLRDRKALCDLDIWFVKVGYSKGVLSSDVMKTVSLGCPEEKVARVQEMASERQKVAAELSRQGLQVTAADTTLIFESEFFSDPALRSKFVQQIVNTDDHMRKFCWLEFTKVELKYQNKVVRTIPVVCN